MRTTRRSFALASAGVLTSLSLVHTPAAAFSPTFTARQVAFQDAMRALWEEHITWTRLFIVDFVAGAPELEATKARLLRNQTDIGNAVVPYYGDQGGQALARLLTDHIVLAAGVLVAAKAGDTAQVATAKEQWYTNGNDIAGFLHTANPVHWGLADMQLMMKEHLDNTLAEAVAHLTGDWAADIAAYDTVHHQILSMADMLSAGIAGQFPGAFA